MPIEVISNVAPKNAAFRHTVLAPEAQVPRAIVFSFPAEDLAVGVFLPRPSWRLLDKLEAPTSEADQLAWAQAGTAGSGTNTVVLESTTTNPFTGSPTWTTRATLQLGTGLLAEVDGSFGGWVWDPATEYLRMRCTAVGGTAPKDVSGGLTFI